MEVYWDVTRWLRRHSLPTRFLVYAAVATLAFAIAAGAGAIGALMVQGDLTLPRGGDPSEEQAGTPGQEKEDTADQQPEGGPNDTSRRSEAETTNRGEQVASRQEETDYVAKVGDVQAEAVSIFSDSHEKLLRYDALTADDVEKMQENVAGLGELVDETDDLDPPQRYRQQHETFRSAIGQLHEAAGLAYDLAADPTAATQSGFDEYDRLVGEADDGLQRSNDALDRDYASIEGVQKVNPLS